MVGVFWSPSARWARGAAVMGVVVVVLLGSWPALGLDPAKEEPVAIDAGESGTLEAPVPIYRNVTDEVGLGEFLHAGFLGPDPLPFFPETMGPGACWIDYDNDGWLDLYLVNIRYMTNPAKNAERDPHSKLYRNNGDGTFSDATIAANARTQGYLQGCAAADYTGNGYTDLFVTGYNGSYLLRNDGGTFTDVTFQAGVHNADCDDGFPCWASSAVWFDADLDGCLDLFVAHFQDYDMDDPPPFNGPGPGQRNRFFQNNCDGTFSDRTAAVGLYALKYDSWSAVAADLDNDGWPDLYVSNDGDPNCVYLNNGDGTFRRDANSAAADPRSGMGTAIADFDKSGRHDIVTTNFIRQYNGIYQAFGNDYLDIGQNVPLNDAYNESGWAVHWFDLDNDGHLDLMVFNGNTMQHWLIPAEHKILAYRNNGDGSFESVRTRMGDDLQELFVARGGAWADYDNDGDIDALLGEAGENPTHLFRAEGVGNQFLNVDLVATAPGVNRGAVGARVTVTPPGLAPQMQEKVAGTAFLSSSDPRLHFGLGDATTADIEIRWPDGSIETHAGVRANTFVRATQGGPLETLRALPLVTLVGPETSVARLDPAAFQATATAADGSPIVEYAWDFGDGTTRIGGTTETHAFADVGANTVRVTATDSSGLKKTQWTQVLVVDDLSATLSMDLEVFPAAVEPTGSVLVTFSDGAPVRDAQVDLLIRRTTGHESLDNIMDNLPFFMKEFLGWLDIKLTGRTTTDGILDFAVPHNSVQPNPQLPIPVTHPGEYRVTVTGGARGSTFDAVSGSYRVILPDL